MQLLKTSKFSCRMSLILLLIAFGAGSSNVAFARMPKTMYKFDAGEGASDVSDGTILLTPDDRYTDERRFGWVQTPDAGFFRDDLKRSRDEFTIDGVIGKHLVWQADLPSGIWWVTLWLEAGFEDSSTVQIRVGDEPVIPDWHAFQAPAEPRKRLQSVYRIYHGRTSVGDDKLRIDLKAGEDDVRLLGFSLIPDPQPTSAAQQSMLELLREAGLYGAAISLDTVATQLQMMRAENENEIFVSYWLEQVQLLMEAEEHFEKRGWEWAREESGLSIFDRFHQAVMILDGILDRPDNETYPFYERALWYRGRLLYWLGRERGGPNEVSQGQRDLAGLHSKYRGDSLLAMYNGMKIDLPDPCDDLVTTVEAPEWSNLQRELLCRMKNIAGWWVNERQAANGEFGGKLGDDVELLRWWMPLILVGDTVAFKGWKKLADAVWESPKVWKGYSKYPLDVEHASEFIADTAPAMAVFTDDSVYTARLSYSAQYFKNLWTGKSRHGHRFFRSAWFSSTEVLTEPPMNRDLDYNSRAVKAVRYFAWKTGEESVVNALVEWSHAWSNAAMRTDKGKPKGIIPASVRFPDEAINGDEPTWYKANMFWNYFDWPHLAGSFILEHQLFTYTLTHDRALLKPLLSTLDLIVKYESEIEAANHTRTMPETGSEAWAVQILRNHRGFWSVASQWRLLTSDRSYDRLLLRYGTPYIRYILTGDETYLNDGLLKSLRGVRYNTPLLTSEVLHTDRVYVPNFEHLKAMLTGDGTAEGLSPYFAISWQDTDDTFTALVEESGTNRLKVQLFSHAIEPRQIRARLWTLVPGDYKLIFANKSGIYESKKLQFRERGQRIAISLPAQELITIKFERL